VRQPMRRARRLPLSSDPAELIKAADLILWDKPPWCTGTRTRHSTAPSAM